MHDQAKRPLTEGGFIDDMLADANVRVLDIDATLHEWCTPGLTHHVGWDAENMPREWLYAPNTLLDALDAGCSSWSDAEVAEWAGRAAREGLAMDCPGTEVAFSVGFREEDDYVAIVAHPEAGWMLSVSGQLGDYCDEEADVHGGICLSLGSTASIVDALSQRITDWVGHSLNNTAQVLKAAPPSVRAKVVQAIGDRFKAFVAVTSDIAA